MANIFTVPNSRFISFDDNPFGQTNVQPLSTAPRLAYDGLAGLTVTCTTTSSNLTRFSVEGSTGRLFTVTDILTGTLFTVSDSTGLPVLEVLDSDTVVMGEYDTNTLVVSGTRVGIGSVPFGTDKLSVSGNLTVTGNISSSQILFSGNGNSDNWNSNYSLVQGKSSSWDSAFGSAGADLLVRSITGGWVGGNSAFITLCSLSGNLNSVYSTVSTNSANWNFTYSNQSNYLPLSGGTITGNTQINSNLTVYGNISATGNSYFSNTFYSTTSALSVINIGNTGPALYVGNNGTGDIASFYDLDQNTEIFHIGGKNGTFPNVGVKTSNPNVDFTVNGHISASGFLYGNGSNLTGINTSTIDSGVRGLTGNYNSVFSTVSTNSARWVLEDFIVACSDEATNLTTSISAVTFRVPYAMFLNSIRASVNVAPVGSTIIVDVKQTGTSIFSTKLSIDANEETSTTAATPAVISNPNLTDDAKVIVSIDQVGSSTAGRGLKLTFKGYRV